MNMSVLERQRARWKWEQEEDPYFTEFSGVFSTQTRMMSGDSVLTAALIDPQIEPDQGVDNGWPDLGRIEFPRFGFGPCGYGNGSVPEMNFALSTTSSCPPAVASAAALEDNRRESVVSEKISAAAGRERFKKRKAESLQNKKTILEDESKKFKGVGKGDADSKITEENTNKSSNSNNKSCNNKEISTDASKESSKVSEVQKPDYIHVRARRGQATDSHSLAERVRREKISERMKFLQGLVPGCNKITGKAGMLDEIINYVQSLQRQVEFLSMKLALVNPRLDFDTENFLAKEVFPASSGNFQTFGMSSEITNPAYPQFNQAQQNISGCEVEIGISPPDTGLHRTICAPISVPDAFLDSACFAQIQAPATWDVELQNLCNMAYDQGRSTSFPSQQFTGSVEACNLKMER